MRLRTAIVACVLLAMTAGGGADAAASPTISATAGLDGLVRAGRWAPVVVTIVNDAEHLAGELVVAWGKTRVRRGLTLPAPSTHRIALHIRTGDVRDAMTVSFEREGRTIASADVPLRTVSTETHFIVCLGMEARRLPGGECTAVVGAASIPASPRAFDAADEVIVGGVLSSDHRAALQLWQSARAVENVGSASPATGAVPAPTPRSRHAAGSLSLYFGTLAAAAVCSLWIRRTVVVYGTLAAAMLVGSAASIAAGRGSPVIVHHASRAEQFAGTTGALVSMRAIAEDPSGAADLAADAPDGTIDMRTPGGDVLDQRFDESGAPLVYGDGGLGGTRGFTLDAATAFRAFDVSSAGGVTAVTNVSGSVMRDCDLPDAFAETEPVTLQPGDRVETARAFAGDDPLIACTIDGAPVRFRTGTREVVSHGTTTVVLHLPRSMDRNAER